VRGIGCYMAWRLVGVAGFVPEAASLSLAHDEILKLGRAHVKDASKNVSRAHLHLEVSEDGLLYATSLSFNIPTINRRGKEFHLTKDGRTALADGDEILLIQNRDYVWKVELVTKRSRDAEAVEPSPPKRPRVDAVASSAATVSSFNNRNIGRPADPPLPQQHHLQQQSSRGLHRIFIPLLGAEGGLDRAAVIRIAEDELAKYPESLKVFIISNEAISFSVPGKSVRHIQIVETLSEEEVGTESTALVVDVSWRWKPASLTARKYFNSSVLQHCKNAFGATAKAGGAYLVQRAQVNHAELPAGVVAFAVVVTSLKSDGLSVEEATIQLRTIYQAILSRFTV